MDFLDQIKKRLDTERLNDVFLDSPSKEEPAEPTMSYPSDTPKTYRTIDPIEFFDGKL